MADLIADLELDDQVVHAKPGAAWIWTNRGLRPLPAGVGPSGPTRLGPVLRARVLSPVGLARAVCEPLLPRTPTTPDVAVGTYLARRFGTQVRSRLVDPVLGSLHAGDVDRLSLHATAPHLAAQAERHRSLLLAHRARRKCGGGAPTFATFRNGLTTLVEALAAHPAITVPRSTAVTSIRLLPSSYEVASTGGETFAVDGIVLAVPSDVTRQLIASSLPAAASPLDEMRSVSVATVLAAYPTGAVSSASAFSATGMLVPSSAGRTLKAATFLSRKWDHLATPEAFLVRLSAGRSFGPPIDRIDDDELVTRVLADLVDATGLTAAPLATHVVRWPGAMSQLEVGHLERLATLRGAIAPHPGLVLAGAPYDGLGLAACVSSGHRAAEAVLAAAPRVVAAP
jgi:oxygen-dependent protoporphyrinogen oxidase